MRMFFGLHPEQIGVSLASLELKLRVAHQWKAKERRTHTTCDKPSSTTKYFHPLSTRPDVFMIFALAIKLSSVAQYLNESHVLSPRGGVSAPWYQINTAPSIV